MGDDDEDIEEMSTPGASKNEQTKAAPDVQEEEEVESEESAESDIELEELEGLVKDEEEVQPEMGDDNLEVTDEMMEEANSKRSEAMCANSDGNFEEAVKLMTEAIKKNPHSANMYAKRAMFYVKWKKPSAAIKDCEKALSINKDSAQPYKWRGRAYRLQGKYVEALYDFQTANRLDFDETCYEWIKEVEPNAKKISDHNRRYARKHEEHERKRMPSDELKPRKSMRKPRNDNLQALEDSPVDFQADSLVVCQGECPVVSLEGCPVAWEVCPVVWAACLVAWAVCLVVCPEECPVVCPEECLVVWVEQQVVCRILMPLSKTRNLWRQCRILS